jgi:hypothetical protein
MDREIGERERLPLSSTQTRILIVSPDLGGPLFSGVPMNGHPELNAMARRVIDANHYMTLATRDPDGDPRLSPVYYTAARYTDFYWLSSPQAQHSRNLTERRRGRDRDLRLHSRHWRR